MNTVVIGGSLGVDHAKPEGPPAAVEAYCSWCFAKTKHTLTKENLMQRNTLTCGGCGKNGVVCRLCSNMARDGAGWFGDQMCAEHSGEVRNLETLGLKVDSLLDWKRLFERRVTNVSHAATVATFAAGGAAILVPAALVAAPAIGGFIGSTFIASASGGSLYGAAATNAGLAALGGGSVASGGLGIAGGVFVMGACGALLGARQGAVLAQSYFGEVDDFDLRLIREGGSPGVIVVSGFLTQGVDAGRIWREQVAKIHPKQAVWQLHWESKTLHDIGSLLAAGVGSNAFQKSVGSLASKAVKSASTKLGGVTWALSLLGLAQNPWHVAMTKAAMAGQMLGFILSRLRGRRSFILMGHSLGARVIFHSLQALAQEKSNRVLEAHLMGGAVGREPSEDWSRAAGVVKKRLHNYWSSNDDVLSYHYRIGTAFTSDPIGSGPIMGVARVENHDCSLEVNGHTEYIPKVSELVLCARGREGDDAGKSARLYK